MSRPGSLVLLLLACLAIPSCARRLRPADPADHARTVNQTMYGAFIGVDTKAPSNAIATLTFTPKFGKPVRQTTGSSDQGLIVPVVFSNKGRDALLNSTCGSFDTQKNLYQVDAKCIFMIAHHLIEKAPRVYQAAPVVVGPPVLFANQSNNAITYTAWTLDSPVGFHFFVLSRAPESVTLTKIKVTGEDFKTMMSVPDITLPPALVDSR